MALTGLLMRLKEGVELQLELVVPWLEKRVIFA
jgi:hypothetical protein